MWSMNFNRQIEYDFRNWQIDNNPRRALLTVQFGTYSPLKFLKGLERLNRYTNEKRKWAISLDLNPDCDECSSTLVMQQTL